MPPVKMRGDGRMAKKPKQTLSRLLSYMLKYKGTLTVVGLCVVFSAVAQAASSASLGTLVDDYITPMLGQTNADFGPLLKFLTMMACIYFVGMVSSFLMNFLMVKVSQGTQKTIRDQMFTHMQTLPIRYFDTHQHMLNRKNHFTYNIIFKFHQQIIHLIHSTSRGILNRFHLLCHTTEPPNYPAFPVIQLPAQSSRPQKLRPSRSSQSTSPSGIGAAAAKTPAFPVVLFAVLYTNSDAI